MHGIASGHMGKWLGHFPHSILPANKQNHMQTSVQNSDSENCSFQFTLKILLSVGTDRNKEKFMHGWGSKQTPILEIQIVKC